MTGGDACFTGPPDEPCRYRVDDPDSCQTGGQGRVYYAVSETGTAVALKMLTGPRLDVDRALLVASQLSGVDHPHLARQLDAFFGAGLAPADATRGEDGFPFDIFYTVCEWVDGEDLEGAATTHAATELLRWVSDIAEGVAHLHGLEAGPLIHRDIKPGNVRITTDGRAVLIDYGCARFVGGRPMTTGVGTPWWIPPEAFSNPTRVGPPADVWGIGALAFWSLVREPPFPDARLGIVGRLAEAAEAAGLARPSSVAEHIAPLLARDPASRPVRRPAELLAWAAELRGLAAEQLPLDGDESAHPVGAELSPPAGEATARPVSKESPRPAHSPSPRKRRRATATVVVVAVASAAAVTAGILTRSGSAPASSAASRGSRDTTTTLVHRSTTKPPNATTASTAAGGGVQAGSGSSTKSSGGILPSGAASLPAAGSPTASTGRTDIVTAPTTTQRGTRPTNPTTTTTIGSPPAEATIDQVADLPMTTAVSLPAGSTEYIYGCVTGGGMPSTPLSSGNYASVTNANGNEVAALGLSPTPSASFTTQSLYYAIGGIGVSHFSKMTSSFNKNPGPGASTVADSFTVNSPNSLVVVVGLGGDEQALSLSGLPGLAVDASTPDLKVVFAHTTLGPGTYAVTETTSQTSGHQDSSNSGDLLGVFVFAPN